MANTGNTQHAHDLFNKVRMGYMVISSQHKLQWKQLMQDGYGMDVSEIDGNLVCRMDEQVCRFLISPGDAEDVHSIGLEITDMQGINEVLSRLQWNAIAVTHVTGQQAALRGVNEFWRFQGPKKVNLEIYTQPKLAHTAPALKISGFETGDMGFGHMAIVTRKPSSLQTFWEEIFDMRFSDDVIQSISGVPLKFRFMRFNKRHHSVALGSTNMPIKLNPFRTVAHHVEIQVATFEDLTDCYNRCYKMGMQVMMEIGQHANDKAVSFYVKTPSGFEFECGWNPITVDEANWTPEVWNRISDWGHKPEGLKFSDRLSQLMRSVASLFKKEFVPLIK